MTNTTTPTAPEYSEAKFRELFLFVAARLAGDSSNGSVKLNKALFFSDFYHYANTGEAITGAEYVHRELGPAPRGVTHIQQKLIENNEAAQVILRNGPRAQKMLFPSRDADLSAFSAAEIATVTDVLEALKDSTAEDASNLSHALLAWKLTDEGQTIPYHWVFMFDGPVPVDTEVVAKELEAEIRGKHEHAGVA